MKRLVFAESARRDLLDIAVFLATAAGPETAARLTRDLEERITILRHSPLLGRVGAVASTRELIIDKYVVVYVVEAERICVARIWHGTQKRPRR
jgi:toxin ParE1/3/4